MTLSLNKFKQELNIQDGVIYEVLVTTINDGKPNFAAMGITFEKESLVMQPFVSTTTIQNLQSIGECVIHFSRDLNLFILGALKKTPHATNLAFTSSTSVVPPTCRTPSIFAWLECTIKSLDIHNDRGKAKLVPVVLKIQQRNNPFTRAETILMECIIHATRVNIPSLSPELRTFMRELFLHYKGIISRIAPNTKYEEQMNYIFQLIERQELRKKNQR
ncbi:MAG: DUF447 domain-containing protein [Promethearchaeota archaeon]